MDFVTIVERLVLAPLYKESRTDVLSPAAATSSASADATSSASSAPKKGKGKSRKEKDEGSTSESTTDDISPATATSSSSFSPASSSSPSPSAAAAVAAVTSSASSASKKGKGKSRSKEDVASAGVGVVSSAGGNGAGATPAIGVTVAAGAVVGGPGRQFTPSKKVASVVRVQNWLCTYARDSAFLASCTGIVYPRKSEGHLPLEFHSVNGMRMYTLELHCFSAVNRIEAVFDRVLYTLDVLSFDRRVVWVRLCTVLFLGIAPVPLNGLIVCPLG